MSFPKNLLDQGGPPGRMARLDWLLPELLKEHSGNVAEIGAGCGETTRILLRHAQRARRTVLVVDPWEGHDGVVDQRNTPGYAYTYENFRRQVGHVEHLVVCRNYSNSGPAAKALQEGGPWALIMVDARMDTAGALEDLMQVATLSPPVICMDDYGMRQSVRNAVHQFLQGGEYQAVRFPGSHEIFLHRHP